MPVPQPRSRRPAVRAPGAHRLSPNSLDADLFFKHGSQDQFAILSPLYATPITALGLAAASILLLALGQALWALGAIVLIRALLEDRR